ncbi:major facilitator super transporter protein [Modicella reniformis]|uniref:GPI ethanolamine phosphate transferase 2 n=1 Tax=Modicella reniformis TaxID=1440133 RepID=A0A9P6INE4_9FUNG|nr:major facilitator super transporter protein [Modicella reniformis]
MRPWILYGVLLASLACQLVGLVMFAKGFFPYKAISISFASLEDLPPPPSLITTDPIRQEQTEQLNAGTVAPRFGKVVLMLIDALRSDFLYGNESDFLFMQSLIDSHRAIPFTALASAPTVTLPRLKALTTGTVPGFLDAILNIAESDQSSTLGNQDNWVVQLARSPSLRGNTKKANETGVEDETIERRNIGFFGDDTWIKLFPGLFFRTDGTSSFFAMDTVEVDNNVTRHVAPELAKDDWDGLIFHYLGLDHVGHSGGPKSALMRPKQAEMDGVAETIYKSLVEMDTRASDQEKELPTLFILCGDHGMNEVGNHGGSSKSETSTSFLFMSSQFEHPQARMDIQGMVDPYRHAHNKEEYQYYKGVRQVDLVPTLSLLMGLPIPKNNVGKLIPELFYTHSEFEKLRALQINAHQVAGVLKNMWSDFEVESSLLLKDYRDAFVDQEATSAEDEVEQGVLRCASENSQEKRLACLYTLALADHASLLEMTGTATGNTAIIYQHADQILKFRATERAYFQFLEESSSMLSTALSEYDMPLLTNGSLMMAFAIAGLMFCSMQTSLLEDFKASCFSPRSSTIAQRKETSSKSHSKPLPPEATVHSRKVRRSRRNPDRNEINWAMARVLSIGIFFLYLATLFASSFVEEEHQFWYFFGMTWWAVLALISGRYLATITTTTSACETETEEGPIEETRQGWHVSSSTAAAGYCILQMAILRLLRGWNQTGQNPLALDLNAIPDRLNTTIKSSKTRHGRQACQSAYFGDEVMSRVHTLMSMVSSVGYSTGKEGLAMSGYEMARGCYAALGIIVVLAFVLKFLSIAPARSLAILGADPIEAIQKERTVTLFTPSILLGVATLLLILLSRRHNAPLFVLFATQLYLYINWTTLIRLREPMAEQQEDDTIVYIDEVDDSDGKMSGSLAPMSTTNGTGAGLPAAAASQPRFRSLPGQNSIHSCSILLWTLSSFFLFGNSNSIASIDISNAYVGIQAYDIVLTGVLTFVSNWAGPIWWCLAGVIVMKWDMELELAWAKQDQEARLKEEEEKSWKSVSGWRREDKGTWNRKTKKRIMLYKKAVAKSREEAKKQQEQATRTVSAKIERAIDDDADTILPNGNEEHVQRPSSDTIPQTDFQDGDAFYVYEEQVAYIGVGGTAEKASTASKPYVLECPHEFRRYLLLRRVLDHLILTSLFFGVTLYILSIAAIILRHHLFIWTVFSPKVLYQFAWTVLYQLVVQVLAVGVGVWTCVAILPRDRFAFGQAVTITAASMLLPPSKDDDNGIDTSASTENRRT